MCMTVLRVTDSLAYTYTETTAAKKTSNPHSSCPELKKKQLQQQPKKKKKWRVCLGTPGDTRFDNDGFGSCLFC